MRFAPHAPGRAIEHTGQLRATVQTFAAAHPAATRPSSYQSRSITRFSQPAQ